MSGRAVGERALLDLGTLSPNPSFGARQMCARVQFLAVLQTQFDGRLDYGLVDGRKGFGVSRRKARLKAACWGTGWLSKSVKPRSV